MAGSAKLAIVPIVPLVMPLTLAVASVPFAPRTNEAAVPPLPSITCVPAISVPLTVNVSVPLPLLNLIPVVRPEMSRVTPVSTVTLVLASDMSPDPVHEPLALKSNSVFGEESPANPMVPLLAKFPAMVRVRLVTVWFCKVPPELMVSPPTVTLALRMTVSGD